MGRIAGRVERAEVRLFHALPRFRGTLRPQRQRPIPKGVLKKLFTLAQPLPGRPRISAAVTEGDAASEILRHARLVKADLIAVGMHAAGRSVSPLVTRLPIDAPCPVLAVDENRQLRQAATVSTTFWLPSISCQLRWRAADYAFALARTVGAQVTVVHVLPEHWEGPRRTALSPPRPNDCPGRESPSRQPTTCHPLDTRDLWNVLYRGAVKC